MIDWTSYGKVTRSYKGSGSLCLDAQEVACDFELVQMANGNLYASCRVPDSGHVFYLFSKQPLRLDGKTEDGRLVTFSQNMITKPLKDNEVVVYGRFAKIGPESLQSFNHFKFALTNLTLNGDVRLNVGGFDITIMAEKDYTDIINELRTSRGVDITSEVTVRVEASVSTDSVILVVDDLCLLFTLAFGNRVTWLYYDIISPDGKTIESFHRSAITKPFVSLPLITSSSLLEIKKFVEKTFPELQNQKEFWDLRKAADAYTDAKVEGDFLEFRALKLVILMEHLKSRYLSQENKEFILNPPEKFNAIVEDLIELVRQALASKFPDEEDAKFEMMANHVRGLNWYPFGRALAEICDRIGLKVSNKERRRFIDIRNELVHRLKFHPERGSDWEQFTYLMTFIGKIFLAILKYDGYYYDWEKRCTANLI